MISARFSALGLALLTLPAASQTTVTVQADRDNTLYSTLDGSLSNGAGSRMFVGRTGNGRITRGILRFDLSGIPQGATVTSAQVDMFIVSAAMGASSGDLHSLSRVSQNWGEGSTAASSGQGGGGPSTPDSATWIHSFFPGGPWTTPGGDFAASASATSPTPTFGAVAFTTDALAGDVQAFVDDPSSNFGWVLKADAETSAARVYSTRESPTNSPELVVTYEMPLGTSICGPAVPNQVGLSAEMSAAGSATAADNDLTLIASMLPPQVFGFFLASRADGFVMTPGGSFGNLCLSGTIGRFQMQIQNSGSGGAFSIPVDLTAIPQPTGTVAVMPGETYYFQAWYRDSQGGQPGSNFTDGFRIDFN